MYPSILLIYWCFILCLFVCNGLYVILLKYTEGLNLHILWMFCISYIKHIKCKIYNFLQCIHEMFSIFECPQKNTNNFKLPKDKSACVCLFPRTCQCAFTMSQTWKKSV